MLNEYFYISIFLYIYSLAVLEAQTAAVVCVLCTVYVCGVVHNKLDMFSPIVLRQAEKLVRMNKIELTQKSPPLPISTADETVAG